ncbi:hypothetical protein AU194_07175 [Mycobacterium sp. GA-2829]|nr:hypothetical protein AU194_07175 [Mycobacterium sp. GA-2829]
MIALIAGGAVVLVIALIIGFTVVGGGSGDNAKAGDTVQAYLEALSEGDAEKALSYGNQQPANTDFLTDDVLKKQIAKWPISDIRILDEDPSLESIGMGNVHVAVKFGDQVSDANIRMKKGEDGWKLESAVIKLDQAPSVSEDSPEQTLTFFGKPASEGTRYVFPGYLDVGSENPYMDVTAEPLLLDQLTSYSSYIRPTFKLNDEGRDAVMMAVTDAFANCERSNQLNPPDCPTKLNAYDAVDGTVRWGRANLSGVEIGNLSGYQMKVMVTGQAKIPVSYQTRDNETQSGEATAYLVNDADISEEPPVLNFR